jgi:hypothetical protein
VLGRRIDCGKSPVELRNEGYSLKAISWKLGLWPSQVHRALNPAKYEQSKTTNHGRERQNAAILMKATYRERARERRAAERRNAAILRKCFAEATAGLAAR